MQAQRRVVTVAGLALLAAAPFAGAAWLSRAAAHAVAERVALPVHALGEMLAELTTRVQHVALEPTEEAAAILALDGARPELPTASEAPYLGPAEHRDSRAGHGATSPGLPPPAGVLVRRERVLSVARAGIRPSGSPVAAVPWRPRGLALAGVGMIGVGLRDGDVVTKVGGTPATSDGAVVGAVTAALRKGHPALTAEVWRGLQKIIVTVELPKVQLGERGERGERGEQHSRERSRARSRFQRATGP